MEQILKKIDTATDNQLQIIMDAVQQRLDILNPDWDILYLALPKGDPIQRKQLVQYAFRFLDEETTHP